MSMLQDFWILHLTACRNRQTAKLLHVAVISLRHWDTFTTSEISSQMFLCKLSIKVPAGPLLYVQQWLGGFIVNLQSKTLPRLRDTDTCYQLRTFLNTTYILAIAPSLDLLKSSRKRCKVQLRQGWTLSALEQPTQKVNITRTHTPTWKCKHTRV